MAMASRLAWLATPAGRKFSFGLMCAGSCTAWAVEYVPHTFLLYKYKEIVSMYESLVTVPLDKTLEKRFNEVVADLSLPKYESAYIEPFTVFGFDLFRAGSAASRFGAIIGIPINFTYKDVESINPEPILVNNEKVNWNRQDAKQLLNGLVLGEDAQRYGMAREIMMVRHDAPLIRSGLAAFFVSSTYLACRTMNEKLHLLNRPLAIRSLFYVTTTVFTYGLWALQVDTLTTYWEKEADYAIAQLGDRYKKGAIEFYEKMLKRNSALRSLLGAKGEEVYTPSGNERYIFRQPTLSINERRKFFIDALMGVKETEGSDTEGEALAAPA